MKMASTKQKQKYYDKNKEKITLKHHKPKVHIVEMENLLKIIKLHSYTK